MRDGRVAGVELAAGSSSRLGTNKLLIDIGGETVAHRAARRALEAGLAPVVAVLGFEADRVANALGGLEVALAVEPGPRPRHALLDAGGHRTCSRGL